MRPIGVCEVDRRIISKAILFIVKGDIQEAAGANQLCGGQIAGVEAAVHAVRQLFNSDDTEGILLVDASNAFNSLNRANALANVSSQCPPFSTVLVNLYRESSGFVKFRPPRRAGRANRHLSRSLGASQPVNLRRS